MAEAVTKLPVKTEEERHPGLRKRHPFERMRREMDRLFDEFDWRSPFARSVFDIEPEITIEEIAELSAIFGEGGEMKAERLS